MDLSVFDIPLLRDTIILHLSRHDIAQCALVSKQWNDWFVPSIWHDVNLDTLLRVDPDGKFSALENNHHHVRSISAFCGFLYAERNVQLAYPARLDRFLSFLDISPTIQSLTIGYFNGDEKVQTRLVSSLNCLPKLRKLDLSFHHGINVFTVLGIILVSSSYNIESLRIDIPGSSLERTFEPEVVSLEQERSLLAKSTIEDMKETRIKELTLSLSSEIQEDNIFVPLLEQCPQLEYLNVGSLHSGHTLISITDFFRKNRRATRLKHLCLGPFILSKNEVMANLLNVLGSNYDDSSGRNGHGGDISWTNETTSQEYLETHISPEHYHLYHTLGRRRTLATTQDHSSTLSSLQILGHPIHLVNFIYITTGLPNLRLLKCGVMLKEDTPGGEALNSLVRMQWTCLGLVTLNLSLGFSITSQATRDTPWRTSPRHLCTNYVFSQLARLKKLEEWDTYASERMCGALKLESGYLNRLSDLKQLRIFRLRGRPISDFGPAEGRWIVENWPGLLLLKLHKNVFTQDGEEGFLEMQEIFRANLPSIRFEW